jgi:uncharacterized protein (DUF2141 family)
MLLTTAMAVCALSTDASAQRSGTVRFNVTGIDADRGGRILCALYASEDNWLEDDPFRDTMAFVNDETANCVFTDVPEGVYATAALHDEDGDSEMDTTLGFPEEGYCMSRDAEDETMLKPDWDDARFRFEGNDAEVSADVKY